MGLTIRSVRGAAALLLAMALASAGTAAADPKEAHKLGVEALAAGRWADAERFFRAAIAERPQEKVTRVLRTAYLPHYYLGVALSESGDCTSALAAWAESEKQGHVQRSKQAGDLGPRRRRCEDHLGQVQAARAEVEQLLDQVGDASGSLASLGGMAELAPLWSQGQPSFATRQRDADNKLAEARKLFEVPGDKDALERLDTAKALAQAALAELGATIADARKRLAALNAAIAQALEKTEEAEEAARKALRSVSDLTPYPRRLGARVGAVDRLLQEIQDNKPEPEVLLAPLCRIPPRDAGRSCAGSGRER